MKTTTALSDLLHEYLTDAEISAARKQAAISARIALWRVEHNMTQKQFAEYVGVTQAMVSKWESGEYNFTVKTMAELCDKLGLDLNQLFTGQAETKAAVSYVFVSGQVEAGGTQSTTSSEFSPSASYRPVSIFSAVKGGTVA